MRPGQSRILPFHDPAARSDAVIGRVRPDGSISFRGVEYATLKDVPPECLDLRPDAGTLAQWRRLYAAVNPRAKARS